MTYTKFKHWLRRTTVAALIFLLINTAQAGTAGGDIIAPRRMVDGGEFGSSALFVYSEREGYTGGAADCTPGALRPNSISAHYTLPDLRTVANPIPLASTPAAGGGTTTVDIIVGGRRYGPSLSVGSVPKRADPLSGDEAISRSGETISCRVFGSSAARRLRDGWIAYAHGQGFRDTTGKAAGIAFDPYPVPPAEYPYDHPINLNMEFDRPTDRGDVEYLATDSRFHEPVWTLTIGANGDVKTPDQVELAFSIYPGAQGTVLRTSAGEPVDEAEVIARVRAALIVTMSKEGLGQVTLPKDFELFAPDTVYMVSPLSGFEPPVEYGFGVKAGLDTTGQPPTKPIITDLCSAFPACINGLK